MHGYAVVSRGPLGASLGLGATAAFLAFGVGSEVGTAEGHPGLVGGVQRHLVVALANGAAGVRERRRGKELRRQQ